MKYMALALSLTICLSPLKGVAEENLYSQDERCFETAQSIYDACAKKARAAGGLNDDNHHDCLSRYHQKIDSCLIPE